MTKKLTRKQIEGARRELLGSEPKLTLHPEEIVNLCDMALASFSQASDELQIKLDATEKEVGFVRLAYDQLQQRMEQEIERNKAVLTAKLSEAEADLNQLRDSFDKMNDSCLRAEAERKQHERAAHDADMRTQAAVRREKEAESRAARAGEEMKERCAKVAKNSEFEDGANGTIEGQIAAAIRALKSTGKP